ncbi:MAG: molybdopterin-dependent oxidoreductase [Thermodesulfobacteriota bacterium]
MERDVFYTSCICNCGSNSQCVFKAHVEDGRVVAVEPDDRFNTGIGREDAVLSEEEIVKVRLQRRPCPKGLVFYRYLYHPDRILYPLKREPGSRRGDGRYARISWDEALSTIADKMVAIRKAYGPYSIISPFSYSPGSQGLMRLFSFWGAGTCDWGWSSYDATKLMSHLIVGSPGWNYAEYYSGSASDMLANAKLIVLWGYDPTLGTNGPAYQFAWFIKLAREKGVPVIIIDPRYTIAAEVLADQWIPIKPGTDTAMFMAMAHVLFKEELWDKSFVETHVEPLGAAKWRDYIQGKEDGIEKTPEWAEKICAVPAATIRELTRMVARTKPSWLWSHWAVSRKSHGEQAVRAFAALQAFLGYWGIPGAGPSLNIGPKRNIPVKASWGPAGGYQIPAMFRSHLWAQAVLLLKKVRSGELSEQEYRRIVGWRTDPALVKAFNPKMLFMEGSGRKPHAPDILVTATETPREQIAALQEMEFTVVTHSMMTPTVQYADIILPVQDWMWEEQNIASSGYGGFECINFCPGIVKPPGEVKPATWIFVKLAEKLGVDPVKFFKYYTTDENWKKDWERYQRDCYQSAVDYYRKQGIAVPAWEEFSRGQFINCDELAEKPFVGWDDQIRGGKPFHTASGKIEFFSQYLADESKRDSGAHKDHAGKINANLPGNWGDLTAQPVYQPPVRGMSDPMVAVYPLMLLSPHPRYRTHYLFWDHPWLKDHVYRHRVWLNVADADARGIKDDDMVRIYNDRGTVQLPAYVTSRVMPGIVVIHHGGRYLPDPAGVDVGGSPSTLLGGDVASCVTAAKTTTLVQVERVRELST